MLRRVRTSTFTLLTGLSCLVAASQVSAQAQAAAAADGTVPSVATGRELFGQHCARCHGADAGGSADGPSLLQRVKVMSEPAFTEAVLRRYRWSVPSTGAEGESSARDAMLQGILSRQDDTAGMPAWEADRSVRAGIASLYAYLSAAAR